MRSQACAAAAAARATCAELLWRYSCSSSQPTAQAAASESSQTTNSRARSDLTLPLCRGPARGATGGPGRMAGPVNRPVSGAAASEEIAATPNA